MENASSSISFGGGASVARMSVNIEEARKALEALPKRQVGGPRFEHTAETDALLLEHWPRANRHQVAKLLGMSENTARNRYRELTGG